MANFALPAHPLTIGAVAKFKGYKKPRRINAVSVSLFLIVAASAYAAVCAWPIIAQRADAQNALEDALPKVYRANLLPEPEATVAASRVRDMLVERLGSLGIPDPDRALEVKRDNAIVALDLDWPAKVSLLGTTHSFPIKLHTHAETSAARVSF